MLIAEVAERSIPPIARIARSLLESRVIADPPCTPSKLVQLFLLYSLSSLRALLCPNPALCTSFFTVGSHGWLDSGNIDAVARAMDELGHVRG